VVPDPSPEKKQGNTNHSQRHSEKVQQCCPTILTPLANKDINPEAMGHSPAAPVNLRATKQINCY